MQRLTLVGAIAALTLAHGCGGEPAPRPDDTPKTVKTTYFKDIKPIFDARCNGCHDQSGIAQFSLETFAAASPYATLIKQKVQSKEMPPWPPDAACNRYLGDRSLTEAQIDAIGRWVDEGAIEGDPKDEGPPLGSAGAVRLSRVDLTMTMPVAYTPQVKPDEYRCFVMDWPGADTSYITGFRAKPGNAKVVHHVVAFLASPGNAAEKAIALDAADPEPGYSCFGASGVGKAQWLGGWAPGSDGADLPAGTGIRIDPGSKVIVQMHYNTLNTAPEPDRTSIDIKLDPTVAKEAHFQPWTNPDWVKKQSMDIPAGMPDVMHSWSFDPTALVSGGKPFTMYATTLHMHMLGTRTKLSMQRGDGGEECLLDIPRWNFHWQGEYTFTEPRIVNPGDQLSLECHWDNTPPHQPIVDGAPQVPKDVNWGEGTTDEMCFAGFYYTL